MKDDRRRDAERRKDTGGGRRVPSNKQGTARRDLQCDHAHTRRLLPKLRRSDAQVYASLLVLERLCEAVAEGEFVDMGLGRAAGRGAVIAAIEDVLH